jgi:hypothetical protein
MKLLIDFKTRVDQVLKEQAGHLEEADKEAAIQNALKEHSRYKPQELVYDLAGDGAAFDFLTSGLTSWEKDFSKIASIEFPAGEREPVYLSDDDWTLYLKPAGQVLRLFNDTPQAGQTVRVNYTARHSVDDTAGTVPDADFEAVCHLAAALALMSLANRYIQSIEGTLGADVVDQRTKSQEARSSAAAERKEYFSHLGIQEGQQTAGMAFRDQPGTYPWGEGRLTHPRRW